MIILLLSLSPEKAIRELLVVIMVELFHVYGKENLTRLLNFYDIDAYKNGFD
jgi:hypothetical protein